MTRLTKLRSQLTELLNARSVAAEMFEQNALTLRELDKIQTSRAESSAAETLLDIVVAAPRVVYESLLESLRRTKQEHVYQLIVFDGKPSCHFCGRVIHG